MGWRSKGTDEGRRRVVVFDVVMSYVAELWSIICSYCHLSMWSMSHILGSLLDT